MPVKERIDKRRPSSVFVEELVTRAEGVDYDFRTRLGRLFMADGCCCDMGGAIDLFTRIDPRVVKIETLSGDTRDTIYEKVGSEWQARNYR